MKFARKNSWNHINGTYFVAAFSYLELLCSITAVRIVAIAYVDASFWGALCPSIYRFVWQGSVLLVSYLKWFLAEWFFKSQTLGNHLLTYLDKFWWHERHAVYWTSDLFIWVLTYFFLIWEDILKLIFSYFLLYSFFSYRQNALNNIQ